MKPFAILAASALFAASASADNEIRLEDCPPAVQKTIRDNARGGKIDEVESISIGGKTLYIADVELPRDKDLKIHVAGDGKLVKTREELTLAELPEVVRKAAETVAAGNGKLDDAEKETAGGKDTFHVDIDRSGSPDLQLVISPDGTVLKQTEEADD